MSEKLSDAQVSVSTVKKIKEGSRTSISILLADYESLNDFEQTCREFHSDEDNPVFQLTSWDCLPKRLATSWYKLNIIELLKRSLTMDELTQEAFYAWLSFSIVTSNDIEEIISRFKSEYIGTFDSDKDFGYYFIDNCADFPEGLEYLKTYIDYEKLGNSLLTLEYKCIGDRYVFKK